MVKVGVRKPSIEKSIKARTTGKVKRQLKSSVDPTYGKKGMGWVKDPKKAAYNKVYNKTTVSAKDLVEMATETSSDDYIEQPSKKFSWSSTMVLVFGILLSLGGIVFLFISTPVAIGYFIVGAFLLFKHFSSKKEMRDSNE